MISFARPCPSDFDIVPDGTAIGTDWAEGFMQGVALRAAKWERLFRSEDGASLIFPTLALCGDETGESLLGLEAEEEDNIAAEGTQPRQSSRRQARPQAETHRPPEARSDSSARRG